MVTMSVRGIITSRTTVSLNSKIEWMSSRSSSSSTSNSVASSTMLSSCSSLATGADRARDGVTRLPSATRPLGDRAEQHADEAHERRRQRGAARVEFARPTLRGLAPTSTNETPS